MLISKPPESSVAINDRDGQTCELQFLQYDDVFINYRFKTTCGRTGVSAWLGALPPIWHIEPKHLHPVNCLGCLAK